jgi:hypothetical protein
MPVDASLSSAVAGALKGERHFETKRNLQVSIVSPQAAVAVVQTGKNTGPVS